MTTSICNRCDKAIKGKQVAHVPPILSVKLGIDYARTFHPACYAKWRDAQVQLEELNECGDLEDRLEAAFRAA
jgi:hypothetical protein